MTSSLSFAGNAGSNISVPYSTDLDFDTGDDFTIEWYQYETDINDFPRPFSRGNYPTANIAVSIEDGVNFDFWQNQELNTFTYNIKPVANPPPVITPSWFHFAIVRSSGTTTIYKNGVVH